MSHVTVAVYSLKEIAEVEEGVGNRLNSSCLSSSRCYLFFSWWTTNGEDEWISTVECGSLACSRGSSAPYSANDLVLVLARFHSWLVSIILELQTPTPSPGSSSSTEFHVLKPSEALTRTGGIDGRLVKPRETLPHCLSSSSLKTVN